MSVRYYIGTSGWHYEHWRYIFYPEDLSKSAWLEFYARHFDTVELNNSFYRLPSENAFAGWYGSTPSGFTFAVKVSRYITHIKRLKDCEEPLKNFLTRAKGLKEKLGPLLYQLPPGMHRNDARLESFLSILPKGLKHAVEFRHESWLEEGVFNILHKYNAGLCIFDMPDFSSPVVATADFAYVRFHGNKWLYGSRYTDEELADWAKRLSKLAVNLREVYIYFNNDAEAYAVENAKTLRGYLQSKEK